MRPLYAILIFFFFSPRLQAQCGNDFTLTTSASTVCSGNPVTASISFSAPASASQYTYSWSPKTFLNGNNGTFSSTIITPSITAGTQTTIIYTVVATPAIGNCPVTKTLSICVVNPVTPTVPSIPTRCRNAPTFIVPTIPPGGIFWGTNVVGGGGVVYLPQMPAGTHTFVYTTYSANCSASANGSFTILEIPVVSVSGLTTMCVGNTTTLTATGTNSFTWSTGAVGPILHLSPAAKTVVYAVGTGTNGCTNSSSITIAPVPIPTVQVLGNTNVCYGEFTTLVATGASNYLWSVGSGSAVLTFAQKYNTTMTLTGFNAPNCFKSEIVTIKVKNGPPLAVSGKTLICAGHNIQLKATGATSYTWNNTLSSTHFTAAPITNTSYTVVARDTSACATKKVIDISVLPSPTVWVTGNAVVCSGETITLTPYGAHNYLWGNDTIMQNQKTFQPTTTTSLTVTGTSTINNCSSKAVVTLSVGCTGNKELQDSTGISLFPNPVKDILKIYSSREVGVELYDSQGRLIISAMVNELMNELDLTGAEPGIYFLIVKSNHTPVQTKKIIKVE